MFFCSICCKVVDELTYKLIKYNNMELNCCSSCYKTKNNQPNSQSVNTPASQSANNPEK